MNKKTTLYLIVFAILTNLAASFLFAHEITQRYNNPDNVSGALGFWFLAASLVAWLVVGIVYVLGRRR